MLTLQCPSLSIIVLVWQANKQQAETEILYSTREGFCKAYTVYTYVSGGERGCHESVGAVASVSERAKYCTGH